MTGGKQRFAICISIFVLCTLITGCLPFKSPVSLNCAMPGNLQSMLPKAGTTGKASDSGPTRPHPPVRTGTITLGPKTQLASQSIGTSGGQVAVNKEGDPLNGFVIDVPSGAYSGTNTFTVSSAPITNQTFGSDINPITPMIVVNNGGAFADKIMLVRVPVKVPAGYFAMGFLYDEKTKQLEGMPMAGLDKESITVATCHFSSFFISMIEDSLLQKDIDSKFFPGVDDWQFTNYGSYISPNGHCSGQSQSAMWYYYATPDGKDANLYDRYDNNGDQPATPDLWQDDSLGYRLCSIIQKDYANNGIDAEDNWRALQGVKWYWLGEGVWDRDYQMTGIGDRNTWRLFAYSIKATGLPQLVVVERKGGGHALICYRVNGGTLHVADPNYPTITTRKIDYVDEEFQPYKSGANAAAIKAGQSRTYDIILYVGAWTVVPYDKIAQHWKEFKSKTIGNDKFPQYSLYVIEKNGAEVPLTDGYSTNDKMLRVIVNPDNNFGVVSYRDGAELPFDEKECRELKPGSNLLGFAIFGKVGNEWKYIDFKYVRVIYGSLVIEPSPMNGEANKEYTFKAKTSVVSSKPRYEWTVDGTVQKAQGGELKYTFKKDGSYVVTCKLYDDSTAEKKLVGEAKCEATISAQQGSTPPFVRDTKYLSFVLNPKANCVHDQYKDDKTKNNYDTMTPNKSVVFQKNVPITWSGVNFSGKFKGMPGGVRYKMGSSTDFTVDCSLNGWVSPDGKTIRQLNMTLVYTRNDNAYVETWVYEFKDLPFNETIEADGNLIRDYTVFGDNNPAAHGKFKATYKGPPESYRSLDGSNRMSSGTGTCLNGMWENYTIKGVGPIRFGLKVNTAELNGL